MEQVKDSTVLHIPTPPPLPPSLPSRPHPDYSHEGETLSTPRTASALENTPISQYDIKPVDMPAPLLTREFFEDCQILIQRFYHEPMPGKTVLTGQIPRLSHGAQHIARTTCLIPVLLAFRQKLGDKDAQTYSLSDLPYLMKACLLHDSGRKGEGVDQKEWEEQSARNCLDHLLAMGCDLKLALRLQDTIIKKNKKEEKGQDRAYLEEKLLHDADCLDVIRCREKFELNYLDIFHDFPDSTHGIANLCRTVQSLIRHQNDLPCHSTLFIHAADMASPISDLVKPQRDMNRKYLHEFAPNAIKHQLLWMKHQAPYLYDLFCSGIGHIPELEHLALCVKNYSGIGKLPNPPNTAQISPLLPLDVAMHRLLWSRLFRLFGLRTPQLVIQAENPYLGRVFTCQLPQWSDASPSTLNQSQRARLFLIAAIAGQWSFAESLKILNDDIWIHEFSDCGLYSGRKLKGNSHFTGTPFELELFLDPTKERNAFPDYPRGIKKHVMKTAILFQGLTTAEIAESVDKLFLEPLHKLSEIIERFGPRRSIDRKKFSAHLHQRFAFLRYRFPVRSQTPYPLSSVEQKAINALGNQGLCLPISPKHVLGGNLRISTAIDARMNPVTEAWLRLTPDMTRQLSGKIGLSPPWRWRLEELDYYLNTVFNPELEESKKGLRPMVMNSDWACKIDQLIEKCHKWKDELATELNHHSNLLSVQKKIQEYLCCSKKLLQDLRQTPASKPLLLRERLPLEQQEILTGLPAKSASFDSKKLNVLNHFIIKRFFAGKAWEDLSPYPLSPLPVFHYLLPEELNSEKYREIKIIFYADDEPNDRSFTGLLCLRKSGQGQQATQALINCLDSLGICSAPMTEQEHQHEYDRQLAEYINKPPEDIQSPPWFENCRLIDGKAVYYRPKQKEDITMEHRQCRTVHVFNNARPKKKVIDGMSPDNKIRAAEELMLQCKNTLKNIVLSGGTVDSFTERVRKGIPLDISTRESDTTRWRITEILRGGSTHVYAGSHYPKQFANYLQLHHLTVKPITMRRLDAVSYTRGLYGPRQPPVVHFHRILPEQIPEYLCREESNETCFFESLSLEECFPAHIPIAHREEEYTALNEITLMWPDGTPCDKRSVVSAKDEMLHYIKKSSLPRGIKDLLSGITSDQLLKLKRQNPKIINGIITSLNTIKLTHDSNISDLKLDNTSLKETKFQKTHFTNCQFRNINFTQSSMDSCSFTDCLF